MQDNHYFLVLLVFFEIDERTSHSSSTFRSEQMKAIASLPLIITQLKLKQKYLFVVAVNIVQTYSLVQKLPQPQLLAQALPLQPQGFTPS